VPDPGEQSKDLRVKNTVINHARILAANAACAKWQNPH
jgi:hypothetical protein